MDNCKVCHGTVFYKEAGYYFCSECQTQNEERREAILEQRFEGTRITQRKIAHGNAEKTEQSAQWSTWELYNFVLIGLTDELIELGASSDIKLTVLQLWAFYLKKLEVAFTSKTCRKVPKLARSFHKRDSDIIYGKLKSRKRKRSRASSASSVVSSQLSEGSSNRELSKHKRLLYKTEYERLVSSQTGSESDALSLVSQSLASIRSAGSQSSVSVEKLKYSKHAKSEAKRVKQLSKKLPRTQRVKYQQKHVTTKYRTGPYVITPMKLWAILYLALRIHNQSIQLADMLRLDHLLPAEIALTESDVKFLTQNNEITHKGMRRTCADMAKFLFVSEISCPDFIPLIERYCTDLNLPKGIQIYTQRLVAFSTPMMIFNYSEPLIPNYEGRAMAFIIVVLKILFGMDGITEYEISRIAEKINSKAMAEDELNSKLFSFREWQRYIECRRNVLMSKHFPTKFKNDPDAFGNTGVYVKFIKSALSRREEKPEITDYKNVISRELANAMEKCVVKLGENSQYSEDVEIFGPSSTPQHSYIEQLLQHPMYDLPDILRRNFSDTKVYYMTKPKKIVKIAAEFGIRLQIVNCRLHFVHKLVSQFEKQRLPSLAELNKSVTVTSCGVEKETHVENNQDLSFHLEKQNSQAFRLSRLNQSYYDSVQSMVVINNEKRNSYVRKSVPSSDLQEVDEDDLDFGFQDVTDDGKLLIPSSQYSDSDNKSVDNNVKETEKTFSEKYNLNLSGCVTINGNYDSRNKESIRVEKLQSMSKKKEDLVRDSNGRFVQKNSPRAIKKPVICKSLRGVLPQIESHESRGVGVGHIPSEVRGSPSSEMSCLSESDSDFLEKLFIPSKDYWMYHCVFSRVKSKNFDYFETELPVSFQWLLNECSDVLEMSTEDLYEQVCLIETYFTHIPRADNIEENLHGSKAREAKLRQCRKKW